MTTIMSDMPDIRDILAHPVALANKLNDPIDAASIEQVEGYEGIRRRFMDGFGTFVSQKKHAAVAQVLKDELGANAMSESENLMAAVMNRLEDEALIETPYVFIAINPKMMI